jgi:hypothetical protein
MARAITVPILLVFALFETGCTQSEANTPEVMVFKSPTCGCCSKWVDHMREAGFEVKTTDVADVRPVKEKYSVPPGMASCHTAIVGGYVVEGHVPAEEVKRMLEEQPDIAGLTVPGMPIGSPGMEQGNQVDSYDILTFDAEGNTSVYASR